MSSSEETSPLPPPLPPQGGARWRCDYCTYDNWAKTSRCTMCKAARAIRVIADAAEADTATEGTVATEDVGCGDTTAEKNNNSRNASSTDIYSLSGAASSTSAWNYDQANNSSHDSSPAPASAAKWACAMCTYLNWPKAHKCVQCYSVRKRVSPSSMSPRSLTPSSASLVTPGICAMTTSGSNVSPHSIASMNKAFEQVIISSTQDSNNEKNRPGSGSMNRISPTNTLSINTNRQHQKKPQLQQQQQQQNQITELSHSTNASSPPPPSSTSPYNTVDRNSRGNNGNAGGGSVFYNLPSTSGSGVSPSSYAYPPTASSSSSPAASAAEKWSCVTCTYDNYPRSRSCVICGTRAPPQTLHVLQQERSTPSPPLPSTSAQEGHQHSILQQQQQQQQRSLSPLQDGCGPNNYDYERRMRQLRRRMREAADWTWLAACMGVVEGDMNPVEAYLNGGGDPTRKLTNPEVALLNRTNVYEAGHTLVHLAIRFHREDMLARLLSHFEADSLPATNGGRGVKYVPSYVAPDLASAIRRHVSQALRQRKGPFPCFYLAEWATYSLPPEIEDLPPATQEQLYSELLDRDAQKELESEADIINWSEEVTVRLGSRLHALWNRSAGDCLLDSVLQATWGVFDRDNALRRAMSDSLHEAGHLFYPRWKEWEIQQALELAFTLDDAQLSDDWSGLLNLASQPGAALEQIHVFSLAHVLRRPIVVYGVKFVKSWRGENLGYARFEGIYLPLLWEPSFCSRSPISLGYTRGHFCALVPPEPTSLAAAMAAAVYSGGAASFGATSVLQSSSDVKSTYLPLTTYDRKPLPIHFLSRAEVGREDAILRTYLDVGVTDSGQLVAQQKIAKPPLLVAQMTEEWLNHYRKLAQSSVAPYARGCGPVPVGGGGGGVGGACSINAGSLSPSQPPRRRMVRGSSPSIQQIPDGARSNYNQSSPPPGRSSPLALKKQLAATVPCDSVGSEVHPGVGGRGSPERVGGGGDQRGGGYSSEGDSDEE